MIPADLPRHATVLRYEGLAGRWPVLMNEVQRGLALAWFDLAPECTRVSFTLDAAPWRVRRHIDPREIVCVLRSGKAFKGRALQEGGGRRSGAGALPDVGQGRSARAASGPASTSPPGHPRPGRVKADRGQGMGSPESIVVCAAPRGWIWCVRLLAGWRQAGGIYACCECGTATLEIEATSQAYCAIHHPSVLLRHGDYRIIGGGA